MTKESQKNVESNAAGLVRLNVLLQECGVASRRKADELIEQGVIEVNGKVVRTLGTKVQSGSKITVNGKKLALPPKKMTYLFHKPYLMITSRSDEKGRPVIFELPELMKLPANVQSVGRLDYRSEGLLILTNDGDLALALSHPKYSVEKTYAVLLSTQISLEEIEKLRKGIALDDGLAKPIAVKSGGREKLGNSMGQWVEVVVTEGRNRLVRRMFESLGLQITRLVRTSVGDLWLPTKLACGKMRPVTPEEDKYLLKIKENMLKTNEGKKGKRKHPLTLEEQAVRKMKRKIVKSDEAHARDASRREDRVRSLAKKRKEKVI